MRVLHSWIGPDFTKPVTCEWISVGGEGMWELLERVLAALSSAQTVLEELSGRVSVFRAGAEPELWPIAMGPDGLANLHERRRSANEEPGAWMPTEVVLRASVDLLLPADVVAVDVADWEVDEDRVNAVALAMVPVDDRPEVPPGFRCWKAMPAPDTDEEHSPLHVGIYCAVEDDVPKLWLGLYSYLELWQPWTMGHGGPVPGWRQNLERLRRAMEKVAAATGGTVSLPTEMQAELDRANGVR